MAILLKVKWVQKSDESTLYCGIQHIGGSTGELHWKHSTDEAIRSIEKGVFDYYIQKQRASARLKVGITATGDKYLKTEFDGDHPRHLIMLPSFPAAVSRQRR